MTGAAALSFGGILPAFSTSSYARIVGSNERIRVAVMGVNSRGLALSNNLAAQKNCEVYSICDVHSRAAQICINSVRKIQNATPKSVPDFRRALEDKDIDAPGCSGARSLACSCGNPGFCSGQARLFGEAMQS